MESKTPLQQQRPPAQRSMDDAQLHKARPRPYATGSYQPQHLPPSSYAHSHERRESSFPMRDDFDQPTTYGTITVRQSTAFPAPHNHPGMTVMRRGTEGQKEKEEKEKCTVEKPGQRRRHSTARFQPIPQPSLVPQPRREAVSPSYAEPTMALPHSQEATCDSVSLVHRCVSQSPSGKAGTIAAWRADVAQRRIEAEETRLSVYYVTADDYAVEPQAMDRVSTRTIDQSTADGIDLYLVDDSTLPFQDSTTTTDTVIASSSGEVNEKSKVDDGRIIELQESSTKLRPKHNKEFVDARRPFAFSGTHRALPLRTSTPVQRHADGKRPPTHVKSFTDHLPLDHTLPSAAAFSDNQIFTDILRSCDPPLLHLAVILNELGIRSREHLRAVARMTEETRNREVRAEALKKGVSVLEWAALLDRILLS